ncbi:MAG TPA: type I DNA topoisomerase [Kiritimatiellia bacterium]|nr:type I DNA topoisomerase [Kiritimatiellia bacterium]
MGKHLVIVESPAKAKTINKILGANYTVKASMGHVRDLPQKELGVDVENGFKPKYVSISSRDKVLKELKEAAKGAESILLAPDPDREGEAIAWHLFEALKGKTVGAERFHRVTYNEITAPAIREAFAHPRQIDANRVNAQQARRVLDRIVGYQVSPLLWRRIRGASSAGRVQSVALRLVSEREREIQAFVPVDFWVMGAKVRKWVDPKDVFAIRLTRIDGEKAEIHAAELASSILEDVKQRKLVVEGVQEKEVSRRPQPSYITSTLQQAGSRFFGFTPTRTMRIAQKLYEGVDTGDGVVGLITYMRTDSLNISAVAQQACREFVGKTFGGDYLPDRPPVYKSRGGAQEAHEAIRPTDVFMTPERVKPFLDADELKLYRIIWERFVASQMAPARIAQKLVEIAVPPPGGSNRVYHFRASASQVVFPGYMKVTGIEKKKKSPEEEGGGEEEEADSLPPLTAGEELEPLEWLSEQKQTTPPPRFTESSLIRALEENGVGRPSTYAQTISTLLDRSYVEKDKRALKPTEMGLTTNDFLVGHLPDLFDIGFTASMETTLDEVEEGKVDWTEMLGSFYTSFLGWVEKAKAPPADMTKVKALLEMLKDVKEWAPATKRGKKTYDDASFAGSVEEQIALGEKGVTDRQEEALVKLAIRYRDQIPEGEERLRGLGYGEQLKKLEETNLPPRPETIEKLGMLEGVTFGEARKVGKKTYDDKEFYLSLKNQVDSGKRLSENQIKYLDRLVLKYAEQIPGLDAVSERLGLNATESAGDPTAGPVLEMMAGIAEWAAPVARGKRTWDDREFFESLRKQFAQKKQLSDRQVAALKKMAARYAGQMPGYEARQDELKLPPPKVAKAKGGKQVAEEA